MWINAEGTHMVWNNASLEGEGEVELNVRVDQGSLVTYEPLPGTRDILVRNGHMIVATDECHYSRLGKILAIWQRHCRD